MNYELAKELKDAGFPQKNPRAIPKDSGRIDGDGNLHLAQEPVYIPTLSELIKKCGDKFRSLDSNPNPTSAWGCTFYVSDVGHVGCVSGNTPEEAVARGWLVLNKKP